MVATNLKQLTTSVHKTQLKVFVFNTRGFLERNKVKLPFSKIIYQCLFFVSMYLLDLEKLAI